MAQRATEMAADPWTMPEESFPEDGPFEAKARRLLEYATLAPSGHNTQPWQFAIGRGYVDVFADRGRALPVVDPADRELTISCGAALGCLEIAAARFGLQSEAELLPDAGDTDHLARVELLPGSAAGPAPLFDAIQKRRTTRTAFVDEAVPGAATEACQMHGERFGVRVHVATDKATRREIAQLVAEGDRIQFDDPAFRKELARWVRSAQLGHCDGMSGSGFGMPDILSPVGQFVIRTFDIGEGLAAADQKKIVSGTPALMLLCSLWDDTDTWLNVGRALAHVLLELTARRLTASYLNQPVEVAHLRSRLNAVFGTVGHAQILLRVGQAETRPAPSARRGLEEVLRS